MTQKKTDEMEITGDQDNSDSNYFINLFLPIEEKASGVYVANLCERKLLNFVKMIRVHTHT